MKIYLIITVFVSLFEYILSQGDCLVVSGSKCRVCKYSHYAVEFQSTPETDFDHAKCLAKGNAATYKYLVSTTACGGSACDGSNTAPFDKLINGLKKASDEAMKFYHSEIRILLTTGDHYILPSQVSTFLPLFRRSMTTVSIERLLCSEINVSGCINDATKPKIILKTNKLIIFVVNKFILKEVILEGPDMHGIGVTALNTCMDTTATCCSDANNQDSGHACYIKGKTISTTQASQKPYGLFTLEPLLDFFTPIHPELILNGATIQDINLFASGTDFLALVSVPTIASKISIINSIIQKVFFFNGISYYYDITKETIYQPIVTPVNTINNLITKFSSGFTIDISDSTIENLNNYGIAPSHSPYAFKISTVNDEIKADKLSVKSFSTKGILFHGALCKLLKVSNSLFNANVDHTMILFTSKCPIEFISSNITTTTMISQSMFSLTAASSIIFDKCFIETFTSTNGKFFTGNAGSVLNFTNTTLNKLIFNNFINILQGSFYSFSTIYNDTISQVNFFDLIQSAVSMQNDQFLIYKTKLSLLKVTQSPGIGMTNVTFDNGLTLGQGGSIFDHILFQKENLTDITVKNTMLALVFAQGTPGFFSTITRLYITNVSFGILIYRAMPPATFIFNDFRSEGCSSAANFAVLYGKVFFNGLFLKNTYAKSVLFIQVGGSANFDNVTSINSGFGKADAYHPAKSVLFFTNVPNVVITNAVVNQTADDKFSLQSGLVMVTVTADVKVVNISIHKSDKTKPNFNKALTMSRFTKFHFENAKIVNMRATPNKLGLGSQISAVIEMVKQDSGLGEAFFKNIEIIGFISDSTSAISSINIYTLVFEDIKISRIENLEAAAIYIELSNKFDLTRLKFNESIGGKENFVKLKSVTTAIFKDFEISHFYGTHPLIQLLSSSMTITNMIVSNIGSPISAGFLYLEKSTTLLKNITLEKCNSTESGGAIYATKFSNLEILDSVFNTLSSKLGGFIFILQANTVKIKNANISDSYSTVAGGVFYIKFADKFETDNVLISHSKNVNQKGIIYILISVSKTFTFKNITFSSNVAKEGSAFYIFGQANLNIKNVKIINCSNSIFFAFSRTLVNIVFDVFSILDIPTIKELSTTDVLNFNGANVTLKNGTLNQNKVMQNLIFAKDSIFHIDNCIMRNNSNSISNTFQVVKSQNSNFTINNSIFFNAKSSHLEISKSLNTFINNSLFEASAMTTKSPIYIENSQIYFFNNTFQRNTGLQSGIIQFEFSDLTLRNCIFKENTALTASSSKANDLFGKCEESSEICKAYIEGSNFEPLSSYSIRFDTVKDIIVSNSVFNNLKNFTFASGMAIFNSKFVEVARSKFTGLTTSLYGAAINIQNSLESQMNVKIDNCEISDSKGMAGSGFYVEGAVNISVKDSKFYRNSASGNLAKSYAGAGVINCDYRYKNCSAYFKNNVFENNTATSAIPTIFSATPIKDEGSVYKSSHSNISKLSYPLQTIYLPSLTTSEILKNSTYIQELVDKARSKRILSESKFDSKSGNLKNMTFVVTDKFGKILSFLNDCTAQIQYTDSSGASKGTIEKAFARCVNGVLYFKGIRFFAVSNTSRNVSLKVTFLDLSLTNTDNQKTELLLNMKADILPCVKGEILLPNLLCQKCPPGYYSLINPMTENSLQECKTCPADSICPSGDLIIPNDGFWRPSNNSDRIFTCVNKIACKNNYEPINKTYNFQCAPQYTGNICNDCIIGYARVFNGGECVKCSSSSSVHLKFSFLIIFLSLFILAQVFYYDKLRINSVSTAGVLIKIFVNHYQQLSLISLIKIGWEVDVGNYFAFTNYLSFFGDDFYSNDCFFADFDTPLFIFKTVFTNLIPFIICIICGIFLTLFWLVRRFILPKLPEINFLEFLKMSLFLTVYLLYPELVSKGFSLLNCSQLDESSPDTFLAISPNVKCWTDTHKISLFAIGIPGIIIWGTAIPLFFLYTLFQNRDLIIQILRKAQTIDDFKFAQTKSIMSYVSRKSVTTKRHKLSLKQSMNSPANLGENDLQRSNTKERKEDNYIENQSEADSPTIKIDEKRIKKIELYKFVYRGYRGKFYYWEFLIFVKKAIFILLSAISNSLDPKIKIILVLSQFIFFFSLTQVNMPYCTMDLNNIELLSYHILFICAILGTLFYTPGIKPFVTIIIGFYIGLNVFLFLSWILILVKTNMAKLHKLKSMVNNAMKKIEK